MPDFSFKVTGVEPALHSLAPLLHFKVRITNAPPEQLIHAALISTQIQLQPAQRTYTPAEQKNLIELFGPPELWGQTLRNRLWAQTSTTVGHFQGQSEVTLPVPCTADINLAATKYFQALEAGDVSLRFLFSGSVFYCEAGRLQVAPISWNNECLHRLPAQTWRALMDQFYPNASWLSLRRDVFDRLYAYKRSAGFISWEETLEALLPEPEALPRQQHAAVQAELAV
jgi:Family of unknown function (DUF6084)